MSPVLPLPGRKTGVFSCEHTEILDGDLVVGTTGEVGYVTDTGDNSVMVAQFERCGVVRLPRTHVERVVTAGDLDYIRGYIAALESRIEALEAKS